MCVLWEVFCAFSGKFRDKIAFKTFTVYVQIMFIV